MLPRSRNFISLVIMEKYSDKERNKPMKKLGWLAGAAICGLATWNSWMFLKEIINSEWFLKWYLPEIFIVVVLGFILICLSLGCIYCLIKTFLKSK